MGTSPYNVRRTIERVDFKNRGKAPLTLRVECDTFAGQFPHLADARVAAAKSVYASGIWRRLLFC